MRVMVTDKSRFPFNNTVHMLLAPPAGEHPNTNKPNLKCGQSWSNKYPSKYVIYNKIDQFQNFNSSYPNQRTDGMTMY